MTQLSQLLQKSNRMKGPEDWMDRFHKLDRSFVTCDGCGKQDTSTILCSHCHSSYYCSKECGLAHRNKHNTHCKKMQMMRCRLQSLRPVAGLTIAKGAVNTACGICHRWPMKETAVLDDCKHAFCLPCSKGWQMYERKHAGSHTNCCALDCPLCLEKSKGGRISWAYKTKLLVIRVSTADMLSEQEHRALRKEAFLHLGQKYGEGKLDILDYYEKAELFMALGAFRIAEKSIDEMICVDQQRRAAAAPLEAITRRLDTAQLAKDEQEVQRLNDALIKLFEQTRGNLGTYLKGGKNRYWKPLLLKAEANEKLHQWSNAATIYTEILSEMENSSVGTPDEQHRVFLGLARSLHEEGSYDLAIDAAAMSIALDRHYQGGYKCTALALKAQGDIDGAIRVMNRAALYETSWDEENRAAVFGYYSELVFEKEYEKRKEKAKRKSRKIRPKVQFSKLACGI